jgi:hypothetical protein
LHSSHLLASNVLAVTGLPGGLEFVRLLREMENLQNTYEAAKDVISKGKPAMASSMSNFKYSVVIIKLTVHSFSVCSLKDLSRWAFRAAVVEFLKDKNLSLSMYIKHIHYSKGYLPKTLAKYVLVY